MTESFTAVSVILKTKKKGEATQWINVVVSLDAAALLEPEECLLYYTDRRTDRHTLFNRFGIWCRSKIYILYRVSEAFFCGGYRKSSSKTLECLTYTDRILKSSFNVPHVVHCVNRAKYLTWNSFKHRNESKYMLTMLCLAKSQSKAAGNSTEKKVKKNVITNSRIHMGIIRHKACICVWLAGFLIQLSASLRFPPRNNKTDTKSKYVG